MPDIAIVLLPGLHGNDVLFRPLIRHLHPRLQPVTVNYSPDTLMGYDELMPRVSAALPTNSPFVLLAESFSGPLAIRIAATKPKRLQAVVLCNTFVRNPLWFRPRWLHHFSRAFLFRAFDRFSQTKALLGGYSTPELRALMTEARATLKPAVTAHRVRAVLQVDVRKSLADCPVPILYLRGERDGVVPRQNLTEIVAIQPATRVERLVAPHSLLQVEPAAAADAIWRFIESLHAAAQPPSTPPASHHPPAGGRGGIA